MAQTLGVVMQTYLMGGTLLVVGTGLSAVLQVVPIRNQNGALLKIATGAGTLSIVNAGQTATQGYALGAAEVVSIAGPAVFYLAAATATMTAAYMPSYSAGYSLYP